MERRIAAIFVADMVGSTRLMERGERDVITRHKAHVAEVFDAEFAARRGRVVKGTGDGLIGVFDSVVDAMESALAIQKAVTAREAESPDDRRIAYRIAVHLGDVMFDEDDVYGDGVNVASRLEGEAAPGGIVVSGVARDMLKDQIDVAYGDLGDLQVKGVSDPVRAYVVGGEGRKPRRRPMMAAAAVAIAAVGFATAWWAMESEAQDFPSADPAQMAYSLPSEVSLAVLKFDNLSGDPSQDYVGESYLTYMIAQLTGTSGVSVVDASQIDVDDAQTRIKTVAEQGVAQYVLLGSYLVVGDRIQVTARLADALAGRFAWSEQFDRTYDAEAFFDIQSEIIDNVAIEVNFELTGSSLFRAYRGSINSVEDIRMGLEASDAFQRWDKEGNETANRLYAKVLARNPDNPGSLTQAAWVPYQRVFLGLGDPKEAFGEAYALASRAVELDPKFAHAYAVLTWLALLSRDYDRAEEMVNRYIEFADGVAAPSVAGALLFLGRVEEAEDQIRRVLREQPRHHDFAPRILAGALMRQGRYEEAIGYLEAILASDARDRTVKPLAMSDLVAIEHLKGNFEARDALFAELMKLAPNMTIKYHQRRYFDRDPAWPTKYLDALRAAGLPEG